MTESKNRDVQKVELIRDLLTTHLTRDDGESVFLSLTELNSSLLLADRMGAEKILRTIQDSTSGAISFETRMAKHALQESETTALPGGRILGMSDSYPIGFDIHVSEPEKLEKYFEKVLAKVLGRKFDPRRIQSIEFVKQGDDEKVIVMLNEQDSDTWIKIDPNGKYWGKLIEVAGDGSASSDDPVDVANYFNTNKKCPLYSKTGFDLSEILTVSGNQLYPARSVTIEMKSSKTSARRRNKTT